MAKDEVRVPNADERARISQLLNQIGGTTTQWGARDVMDVWLVEERMRADRISERRLLIATWVLVFATFGLVAATVGLIVAG
jgi:hypothetical protein